MSSNVTVIVPTFNRAKYLPACLESLFAQSDAADRIIVVDDGSTDGTADVLKTFGDRIECVRQDNQGKATALNRAMPMVESEYVWVFDDDDVALPDAITLHLNALEGSGHGFSYASYQRATTNEDGRLQPGPVRRAESYDDRALFVDLLEENLLPQPSIIVRNECYKEVGPFDERLVRSQDYEMLLRLSRSYTAAAVEGITYYYRLHDGARGSGSDNFAFSAVNDKWVKYDQIIFNELYEKLSLWEYLPEGRAEHALTSQQRQRALIKRFSVMMRYCLWDSAMADLTDLLREGAADAGLSDGERQTLRRIFENRALLMFRWGYDGSRLRKGLSGGDRKLADQIRVELSKSLYYELNRDLAGGNRRDALRIAAKLVPLLGVRGLLAASRAK